jgi:hypothetical protein
LAGGSAQVAIGHRAGVVQDRRSLAAFEFHAIETNSTPLNDHRFVS